MTFIPRVIDIYHGNVLSNGAFVAAKKSGIWGIIHKATQGIHMIDSAHKKRKKEALDAGLLWGAYHFNDSTPVKDQVKNFLDNCDSDGQTLLVLDFEDYGDNNMSVHDAVIFMRMVEEETNKDCVIYSGNRLKENIHLLSTEDKKYICSKKLWLCQYGPKAVLPKGFDKYWLWQYTGDGIGPKPYNVPGFSNKVQDMNVYNGTFEQLKSDWFEKTSGPRTLRDGALDEV
jgi:lysozyme